MLNRRNVLRLTSVALLFGTTIAGRPLRAQDADQANLPRLALKGYDPVSYFTDGRPIQGKSEFEFTWDEVSYRFASEEHLADQRPRDDPQQHSVHEPSPESPVEAARHG